MRRLIVLIAVVAAILPGPALAAEVPEPLPLEEMVKRRVEIVYDKFDEVTALKVLPVIKVRAKRIRTEWAASYEDYQRQLAAERASAEVTTSTGSPDTSAPTPSGDIYDALAMCESTMTNANTGNGYYGYFQFLPSTWQSLGYSGLPTDYPYATQKQGAIALIARSGWGQFPSCAAKLGML